MNIRYSHRLALRIALPIFFAAAMAFCFAFRWYLVACVCTSMLVISVNKLFDFQRRTVKDMRRLIDAIQYADFSISFRRLPARGLAPELAPAMDEAVRKFNSLLKKYSSEHIFYDMLLNRIDFGVIVVEQNEKIFWLNKWITDYFVSPHPKYLADFARIAPELPDVFRNLLPADTKLLNINNHQVAATAGYFYSENKKLKVISLKNVETVMEESESDAWRKLISVLTHEMMNSLTPIISLSETFAEADEENKPNRSPRPVRFNNNDGETSLMQRAMQTIHRRSKGLVTFVSNYRKLAQIPQPVKAPFPAMEFIEDVSRLLEPDGYHFRYSVNPTNLIINADRPLMEQALINLIRNACESSLQQPEVNVSIDKDEYNRVRIRVADKGDGILPEVMQRIFVPFFTTKPNGSGIGLSISRQTIKLHGGSLTVSTKHGEGSCFTIII
jgi:signal transduction histidine kinase